MAWSDVDFIEVYAFDRQPRWDLFLPLRRMDRQVGLDTIQHPLGLTNVNDLPLEGKDIHPRLEDIANVYGTVDLHPNLFQLTHHDTRIASEVNHP